jgi:hypothetical protein
LRGPGDQFRAAARELPPALIELHVVTNLNAELAEIALENRERAARSGAAFHVSAFERNDQVNLPVGPQDFSFAPDEDRGIGAKLLLFGIQQVSGNHDVTAVLAGFAREHVLHRPFERNRAREGIAFSLACDARLRQHREIESAAIFHFRLRRHLVHDSGELIEPRAKAGMAAPKRLHAGADAHLSGRSAGRASAARFDLGGQRRRGAQSGQAARVCQECSSVHLSSSVRGGTPPSHGVIRLPLASFMMMAQHATRGTFQEASCSRSASVSLRSPMLTGFAFAGVMAGFTGLR